METADRDQTESRIPTKEFTVLSRSCKCTCNLSPMRHHFQIRIRLFFANGVMKIDVQMAIDDILFR